MSDVPTDIIINILSCLPVEPLLKFRSVCKTWKLLIDSPEFMKQHLNRALELKTADNNAKFILCGDSTVCYEAFDLLNNPLPAEGKSLALVPAHSIKFDYPIEREELSIHPVNIMGYCNGLLLVACGRIFTLWNPSTRKYVTLSYFIDKTSYMEGTDFSAYQGGFGYDKVTDDYKAIISMKAFGKTRECYETVVYSLKSDSFKRIKEFPYWAIQYVGGIFLLGALHWLVHVPPNSKAILAFDLGSEEYKEIPLPLHMGEPKWIDIGVFEGCLYVCCNYKRKQVDIWLMKDYGNKDSWAKLLSLKKSLKQNIKPIAYTRSGKQVILEKDNKQLLCYDLEKKSMRNISIKHCPPKFESYLFTGSLVQISGSGHVEEMKAEINKNEEKPKKATEEKLKKAKKSLVQISGSGRVEVSSSGCVEVSKEEMNKTEEKPKKPTEEKLKESKKSGSSRVEVSKEEINKTEEKPKKATEEKHKEAKKRDEFLSQGFKLKL